MTASLSVDSFIKKSSSLLQSFPQTTTLSITYNNKIKKITKSSKSKLSGDKTSSDIPINNKKSKNSVKFKCYEPNSGKCISYTTYKSKELSRLITFIGPNGVSMKSNKDIEIDQNNNNNNEDTKKLNHAIGLASIMSNTKFEETSKDEKEKDKEEINSTIDGGVKGNENELIIEDSNKQVNNTANNSKKNKKKKKGKK